MAVLDGDRDGVTFIGAIFTPWAFVAGGILALLAGIGWFWPKEETGIP